MNIKLDKNDPNPLGKVLKILRKERGFSQTTVAEYLGVHRSTYTKYELGRKPDVSTVIKLSLLYGISSDSIISAFFFSEESDLSKTAELGSDDNEAFICILTNEERLIIDYYRKSIRKSDILDAVQNICFTENIEEETSEQNND